MDDTKKLLLEIDASVELLRRNLTRASGHLDDFTRRADRQMGTFEKRFADSGRGIAGVGRTLDTMKGKMDSFGASMKTAVAGYFAAIGIDTLTRLVKSGLEYASSLGEQAQQLGVTTKALQEYRFAATQAGIEQGEMDQALSQLTRRMGDAAEGAKGPKKAFERLGVSIRDAKGNLIDAGDAIPLIAEGLEKIESPAERAAILVDLFGKAGQKLEPLLKGGSKSVNELRDAAQRLGVVLSEDQIKKADDAADTLGRLKKVLEAKIAGVVADNASSIVEMANALTKLADSSLKAVSALAQLYRDLQKDYSNGSLPGTTTANFVMGVDSNGRPVRSRDWREGRAITAQQNKSGATASGSQYGPTGRRGGYRPSLTAGSTRNAFEAPDLFGFMTGSRAPVMGGAGGMPNLADPGVQSALRATSQMSDLLGKGSKKAAEKLNEWNVQLASLNAQLALAQADLTGSLQDRAKAEKQAIDADLQGERLRIAADKDLTAAQRQKQIAVQEEIAAARKALVDKKLEADLAKEKLEADEDALRLKLDALNDEQRTLEVVARSTRDRRERLAIERRILEIQQEEEKARLEAAIAAGEIADAARARANLETRQAAERGDLERQGAGPGAQYLDELRKSAGELNDDLERVAVDGLESLNDGLVDAIVNGESLGKMFNRIADQIIADLLRIAIQQAIIRPIAENLFGGGGGGSLGTAGLMGIGGIYGNPNAGGGSGGIFGSIFGAIGSLFKGKRAMGGPVSAGKAYLVGERRPELFVPNVDGVIEPSVNGRRGGGSASPAVNLTINAPGATAETVAMIRRELLNAAPQIAAAAKSATLRDLGRPRL